MYIAGIHLSHNQGIEALAVGALAIHWIRFGRTVKKALKMAETNAGPILTKPSTPFRRLLSGRIFALATFGPAIALVGIVSLNGFDQPAWMQDFALPDDFFSFGQKAGIRTFTSALLLATAGRIASSTISHLGSQIGPIGVREKPELVTSGPFAYVRHPMYSSVFVSQLCASVMFWSYIPLISLLVTTPITASKIFNEERLIGESPLLGPGYAEYKERVPYRLIPYIW